MASPLSSTELARMAAAAQVYLDKSVTIQRASKADDGAGHTSKTWPTLSTTMCSLATPSGGYMSELAARLTDLTSWVVTLPTGTDVARDDRLVIGPDTLTVQHVYEPTSLSFVTQVLASELR